MFSSSSKNRLSSGLFWLGVALAVIVVIASLVAGASLFWSIVLGIAIGSWTIYGFFMEVLGSIVLSIFLKMFQAEIAAFAGVWWKSESHSEFFGLVGSTPLFKLMAVTFFFAAFLSFSTGRIMIFSRGRSGLMPKIIKISETGPRNPKADAPVKAD